MSTGTWYAVVSREYGEVVPVLDYGQGPMEYGCDMLYVKATTAARAKTLMVRAFRRRTKGRRVPMWLLDGSPFTGMICQRAVKFDAPGWIDAEGEDGGVAAGLRCPRCKQTWCPGCP